MERGRNTHTNRDLAGASVDAERERERAVVVSKSSKIALLRD